MGMPPVLLVRWPHHSLEMHIFEVWQNRFLDPEQKVAPAPWKQLLRGCQKKHFHSWTWAVLLAGRVSGLASVLVDGVLYTGGITVLIYAFVHGKLSKTNFVVSFVASLASVLVKIWTNEQYNSTAWCVHTGAYPVAQKECWRASAILCRWTWYSRALAKISYCRLFGDQGNEAPHKWCREFPCQMQGPRKMAWRVKKCAKRNQRSSFIGTMAHLVLSHPTLCSDCVW